MDSITKNKGLDFTLLLFFVLLPFVFFNTILDPFLLARQLLTTGFLGCLLFFLFRNKTAPSFIVDTTTILFVGFTACCLVSFSKSQIPDLSHAAFSKYLLYFLFFIVIRHSLLNDLIAVKRIQSYIILFGSLCIIIASLAFLNKTIKGQHLLRQVDYMSGTFGNKNFLSSILFFCLPFYCIGLSLSKKIKPITIGAIACTILLLIMLRTRAVLLALSVFLFLMLLAEIRNRVSKKIVIGMLSTLLVTTILGIWYLIEAKVNLHSSSDIKIQYFYRLLSSDTLRSRIEFWQQAGYIIHDNFFSGIGVGNWMAAYPKYGLSHFTDTAIVNGRLIVNTPHNDFLMVFSEIGFFGFLCYTGIFITMLYQAYWLSKNEAEANHRKNARYVLFFIISYLIIAFFDFPLTRIEHQVVLLIVFSMINARYLKANSTRVFKIPSRLMYLFGCFSLLYASVILFYRITGEQHLSVALKAEKNHDNASAIFEFTQSKNIFFTTDNYAIPLDWHIGKAQFYDGSFAESLNSFSQAYKVNPNNLVVNNDLGSSYVKNGNSIAAVKHYKEALAISPAYEDARINLAATYYNGGDYEKAFTTIDKCNIESKNNSYKQILVYIVEKKLNNTLIRINNPNLNAYMQSKIKTEKNLLDLYFNFKKNNGTFDKYIQSLIH